MNYILAFVIAYFLGSINSAILVGRFSKIDIREHGSGNAGATNVLRTLGKKAAILVLVVDVLKGILSVLIGSYITSIGITGGYIADNDIASKYGMFLAGVGAILGHNYPIYFGFKGGKGILTSAAVIFMIDWRIGILLLVIAIAIIAITRYVSLGSIIASALYPIVVILLGGKNIYYVLFSVFVGILAIYRHKSNIVKLLNGSESKLGSKVTKEDKQNA